MGTTRIKVIDLSSGDKEIKTSRKHAEKLTGAAKIKQPEKKKAETSKSRPQDKTITEETETESITDKKTITESTEKAPEAQKDTSPVPYKSSAPSVIRKQPHHRGAKYQNARKQIENKNYKIREAIELLPDTSTVKFDPAVEIHLNVADKNIKGNVTFPHSFKTEQKKQKYLIFSDSKKDVKGADVIWGNDATIAEIESGKLKAGRAFDQVISTPKFMAKLAKIAKILGPKGMMPNPKNGTVTEDFEKVTSATNNSGYSYKTDPMAPIVHAKIGKLSQKSVELEENLKTLIAAIGVSKIKKATLTSTMGPAVKLDVASL